MNATSAAPSHSPRPLTIAILSDLHYASPAEQARGDDYEWRNLSSAFQRWFAKTTRKHVWLDRPLRQNALLDRFLADVGKPDFVVANGDFSCDSAFIGLSDPAAFESARLCVGKLRELFSEKLLTTVGDHELGKFSAFGQQGGLRLASWSRVLEVGIRPFWRLELGRYVLIGVASPLLALPVFQPDALPDEWPEWQKLRDQHLAEIRAAFTALSADQRVLLFCHDPTALPFLWHEPAVREKLPQVEQTIIGHLHTQLVFWKSKMLAGMPRIRFMGNTVLRMSTALNEARHWRPFHVRLCPALSGIELLNDGGYLTVEIDPEAKRPAQFKFHPLPR